MEQAASLPEWRYPQPGPQIVIDPSAPVCDLESYVPGRMRVRLPKGHRKDIIVADIVESLEVVKGVMNIITNIATGSILLEFDPEIIQVAEIVTALQAANLVVDIGIDAGKVYLKRAEKQNAMAASQFAHHELRYLETMENERDRMTGGKLNPRLLLLIALAFVLARKALSASGAEPWHAALSAIYNTFLGEHGPFRALRTLFEGD